MQNASQMTPLQRDGRLTKTKLDHLNLAVSRKSQRLKLYCMTRAATLRMSSLIILAGLLSRLEASFLFYVQPTLTIQATKAEHSLTVFTLKPPPLKSALSTWLH